MPKTTPVRKTPDYGIDAPGVIRTFYLVGLAMLAVGFLMPSFAVAGFQIAFIGPLLILLSTVPLILGSSMVAYGLKGKFNQRDLMLDLASFSGHEKVLDIGTGRGLLAVGAAKRLTSGRVVGIDIWSAKDLSGNTLENAQRNIELEQVEDKVELKNENACKISFPDESFDVILSLLCLHNIEDQSERDDACREIARLLKPGGIVLLADYVPTHGYGEVLSRSGLAVEKSRACFFQALGLMWLVIARKEKDSTERKTPSAG